MAMESLLKGKTRIDGSTEASRNPGEAFTSWKSTGSPEKLASVMKDLRPTIESALTTYAGGDSTLRTRANILAREALTTYEPGRVKLSTHVHGHLKRLQRYKNERNQAVHIPENVVLDASALKRFEDSYIEEHGKPPTDIETRDATGMSEKRLYKARNRFMEVPASGAESDMGDAPSNNARDPYKIWMDYVYHDLGTVDRQIFEAVTGYNGKPIVPKKEIARRLRITPAAISSRVSKIMRKMQEIEA